MNVSESVSTVILFRGAVTFGLVVGSCRGIFFSTFWKQGLQHLPPLGGADATEIILPTAPEPLTISSYKILPS